MDFHQWRQHQERKLDDKLEHLATQVIDAALEVHRALGPGLPEKVYEVSLSHELDLRGIPHVCQAVFSVAYKGKCVGEGRIDILVAERLVVELKSVDQLNSIHRAQVVTYLTVMGLQLALLINFNVELLKDGLKRVIKTS